MITGGGETLVVAETFAGRLTAFSRRSDGSLSDRRVWAALPSGAVPDGICLDGAGAIWVASPTSSECLRIVEGGDVVDRVTVPGRSVVACALGGDDGSTLFLATTEHDDPKEAQMHHSGRIESTHVEAVAS